MTGCNSGWKPHLSFWTYSRTRLQSGQVVHNLPARVGNPKLSNTTCGKVPCPWSCGSKPSLKSLFFAKVAIANRKTARNKLKNQSIAQVSASFKSLTKYFRKRNVKGSKSFFLKPNLQTGSHPACESHQHKRFEQ